MITDSFDTSEPIITPESFFGERKNICKTAIVTFSREIYPAVLEKYENTVVGKITPANCIIPIHLVKTPDFEFIFYLSGIGSTLAGIDVIEVNWLTGAENFVMFGSAGSLDGAVTTGKYVVPTEAYRDEGLSYHYAPPADYIKIKNSDKVASVINGLGLPTVQGRVWTTDGVYCETRNLFEKRKAEGCIAVEMELAGVQAVCDHHGFELYDFLVTGDVLDAPTYDNTGLKSANHSFGKFDIALEIAKSL